MCVGPLASAVSRTSARTFRFGQRLCERRAKTPPYCQGVRTLSGFNRDSAHRGGDDDGIGGRHKGGASVSKAVGAIHVITGPMFAGKTSALVSAVTRETLAGRSVFVIKSALDEERFGKDAREALITHDGARLRSSESASAHFETKFIGARVRAVKEKLNELVGDDLRLLHAADVVAIDEAQFMSDLVPFARHCAEVFGQTVYVAGLDGDFKRQKFGNVLDLVPVCDSVTRLKGKCATCANDSLFSLRVVKDDDNLVSVGGSDKYAPACRACFVAANTDQTTTAVDCVA